MAEKRPDCRLSLKASKSVIHSDVYTLKFPNFFKLPEYDDRLFQIKSPSFQFANATWYFQLSSSDSEIELYKKIAVRLFRLNYKTTQQSIMYKVSLLDAYDYEYKDFGGMCLFTKAVEKCFMWFFNYRSPTYDRRDTFTLIIHLIQGELTVEDADQVPPIKDLPEKEAERTENCKISLKSSKKSITSNVYTMELSSIFTRQESYETPFEIKSPPFDFANGTWCFLIHSNSSKEDKYKNISVFILKLNSESPEQKFFYLVTFSGMNSRICYGSACLFEEDKETGRIMSVEDYNPCDDSYGALIFHLFPYELSELKADMMNRDVDLLSQDFRKLFLSGMNPDLTLRVADKEFRVHRDILIARSQVFEPMLSHDMLEKNKGIIDVSDCDPRAMEQLLFYIYSGKVETLDQDNVFELYYAADKYSMLFLKDQCANYIKKSLSPPMVCYVIQLALNHKDTDLLKCATEYFANHLNDILRTIEWMSFLKSNSIVANELLIKATKK